MDACGIRACAARCARCARCRYISFSRREHDCSWYAACDLERVTDELRLGHHSVQIKNRSGHLTESAESLLHRADHPASLRCAYAPRAPPLTPPRVYDVFAYTGRHWDHVLAMRMAELSGLPTLTHLVVERHPGGGTAAAIFPRLERRFAAHANRTRSVVLDGVAFPPTIDLEAGLSYDTRQALLGAAELADRVRGPRSAETAFRVGDLVASLHSTVSSVALHGRRRVTGTREPGRARGLISNRVSLM